MGTVFKMDCEPVWNAFHTYDCGHRFGIINSCHVGFNYTQNVIDVYQAYVKEFFKQHIADIDSGVITPEVIKMYEKVITERSVSLVSAEFSSVAFMGYPVVIPKISRTVLEMCAVEMKQPLYVICENRTWHMYLVNKFDSILSGSDFSMLYRYGGFWGGSYTDYLKFCSENSNNPDVKL